MVVGLFAGIVSGITGNIVNKYADEKGYTEQGVRMLKNAQSYANSVFNNFNKIRLRIF